MKISPHLHLMAVLRISGDIPLLSSIRTHGFDEENFKFAFYLKNSQPVASTKSVNSSPYKVRACSIFMLEVVYSNLSRRPPIMYEVHRVLTLLPAEFSTRRDIIFNVTFSNLSQLLLSYPTGYKHCRT
jgi:hypothetical protein